MELGKIKPSVTLAAQFVMGVEVECIQHDGKLFLPVLNMGEFGKKEAIPDKEPSRKESSKEAQPEVTKKKVTKDSPAKTSYTEEELMDMEVKELTKILKGMGIDPNDSEGKNTNKKLRLLILEAQDGADAGEEEEDDEKPKGTSKNPGDTTLVDTIMSILSDYDSGTLTAKKALAKLMDEAVEGVKEADVKEVLDSFEDDAEADTEAVAEQLLLILKDEKPAKKGKAKKETLVEPEDLEVGQRVSVYWEDQKEWYDGEVASIKKGKVTIDYDDDTTEVLDENNTKIKLLK